MSSIHSIKDRTKVRNVYSHKITTRTIVNRYCSIVDDGSQNIIDKIIKRQRYIKNNYQQCSVHTSQIPESCAIRHRIRRKNRKFKTITNSILYIIPKSRVIHSSHQRPEKKTRRHAFTHTGVNRSLSFVILTTMTQISTTNKKEKNRDTFKDSYGHYR